MAAMAWLAAAARALPPVPMCCRGYVERPMPPPAEVDGVAGDGSELARRLQRACSRMVKRTGGALVR